MNDAAILDFLQLVEPLKKTLRTAWDHDGRQETTAEHSWRLALMTACFLPQFPEVDGQKALVMALIHDLAESVTGDISAASLPDKKMKDQEENQVFEQITNALPLEMQKKFREIFAEYQTNSSPEAHLIKALDKAETILQHNQGKNPENFDYEFNLNYGKKFFADSRLQPLRELLDEQTKENLES
ncbi:HD domain-containing protein [Enterococcus timonensis]|uniref:HD domain-containing protein n=1 Tax=Enterococcus timonensis TaxID=1852364 RepID=UPI0008D93F47|nr:HD domain-containing protein [Enterococcus timonensis]